MAAAVSALLSTQAAAEPLYKGYEIPAYTVEAAAGAIELRQYAPHVVAQVQTSGTRRQGASAGFRALARYIFGGNARSDKIAMTAPVTQAGGQGSWTVRFMMPSEYDIESLPLPKNADVQLQEVAPGRRLAIRFAGRALTGSLEKYVLQLQAYAAQNGLELVGPMEVAYYDDPMTLPWRRRNELSFAVK
jgi:hypothetical protein